MARVCQLWRHCPAGGAPTRAPALKAREGHLAGGATSNRLTPRPPRAAASQRGRPASPGRSQGTSCGPVPLTQPEPPMRLPTWHPQRRRLMAPLRWKRKWYDRGGTPSRRQHTRQPWPAPTPGCGSRPWTRRWRRTRAVGLGISRTRRPAPSSPAANGRTTTSATRQARSTATARASVSAGSPNWPASTTRRSMPPVHPRRRCEPSGPSWPCGIWRRTP